MGVGHVYCGRIVKGLVLYVAWFTVLALGLVAAVLPANSLTLLAFLLVPAISIFAIYFYAALDAYELAKRSDPNYKLRDYNRASIYWLLIVVQLACTVALMAWTRAFVFEAFYIPTRAMTPSILQGDRILVNKLIARNRFPDRGDLIAFYNPGPVGGKIFVQRVVALAGDKVDIDGEHVEINGKRLQRDRIPNDALRSIRNQLDGDAYYEFNAGQRYQVVYADSGSEELTLGRFDLTVPDRSVFVLGDNRNRSRDSRLFGAVHVGDVIGYVQYVHFPAESWYRLGVCQR